MERRTPQREAIEAVIEETSGPLRVGEILERGRERVPSLDQATVYRNLKRLAREGWLEQIQYPHVGTLFERAGRGHHHLFHCRVCTRVLTLPGCALDTERATPPGFVTEEHDVFLNGVCADCRSGDDGDGGKRRS